MRKLLLASAAVAGLACAAPRAEAAFIGATPVTSDVFGVVEGWFGADLFLIADGPVNATLEFLGFEAGAHNTFNINGGAIEYSVNPPPGGGNVSPRPVVLSPGLLDFVFTTSVAGLGSVANGANQDPATNNPNFFLSFGLPLDTTLDGIQPSSGTTVLIALDDTGAGRDDDHDDLVVRLTVEGGLFTLDVAEPATLGLLGTGLLGLGWAARRRRKR